jgi:uncharacterized membrane protein YeaQ/YmgE (transglycosylase-associated protein family)
MGTSIAVWVVFGLIAGGVARWLRPGEHDIGLVGTTLLGIVGAAAGGAVAWGLDLGTSPHAPAALALASVGAVAVLAGGFLGARSQAAA